MLGTHKILRLPLSKYENWNLHIKYPILAVENSLLAQNKTFFKRCENMYIYIC